MTVREALRQGRAVLGQLETAALDSSLILAHSCGMSREKLYMELSSPVSPKAAEAYKAALARRTDGEPVAYITGRKEFWGLGFQVGPGVLCPRPDSEILIETVLKEMDLLKNPGRLHDCCCGPGTLALALAAERPQWRIDASDISDDAAFFFEKNNRTLAAGRVGFTKSNLMEGLEGPYDFIISNPPYLTPDETTEKMAEGWKEPALALDGGGKDGLDIIRRLIPRSFTRLKTSGRLLIEAHPLQMAPIGQILSETGFGDIQVFQDLAGLDRVVMGRKEQDS